MKTGMAGVYLFGGVVLVAAIIILLGSLPGGGKPWDIR